MYTLEEYLDERHRSPYGMWLNALGADAAAKITVATLRMEQGLLGDIKPVGNGVLERRLHFGPGYRIYFGMTRRNGSGALLVLLHGGTKKKQAADVKKAQAFWDDYQRRRRGK